MRIAFSISIDHRQLWQCEDAMKELRVNRSAFFARAGVELAERTLKAAPKSRTGAKKGAPRNA